MKYFISFIVFISLIINAKAYQPILQSNQAWDVTIYGFIVQNVHHTLGNPTTINGQEYTPIIYTNVSFPGEPFVVAHLREDVAEERVYIYENGTEYLLYDFNVEAGDVISILSLGNLVDISIIDVTIVEIDGVSRKKISYMQGAWYEGDYTEGIGSRYGLIDFANSQASDYAPWLTCYYENGELIWDNSMDKFSCNSVLSIEESEMALLEVYPNPTDEALFISFSENISGQINLQVFDTAGKLILEKREPAANVIRLDVSTLSTGNYTLKATGEQISIKPISFLKK